MNGKFGTGMIGPWDACQGGVQFRFEYTGWDMIIEVFVYQIK